MLINRRRFLKLSLAVGAGLALPFDLSLKVPTAFAFHQSTGLRKYATPLRGVGPGGIPVAASDGTRKWGNVVAQHYTVDINQYTDTLHPDLGPTTLRGYNPAVALGGGNQPQKHLGGIVVAQSGAPIQLTFRNNLSGNHPLPVDTTLPGADQGPNRTAVHLHGGFVPWISDGGPFSWWDRDGNNRGPSFLNNQVLNPNAAPNEAEYYYPNQQSARLSWYHDHALGITRLNAYAGIASAYVIRDKFESQLRNFGLPDFVENGGFELPIAIQDKIFVGDDIFATDPTWPGPTGNGSLWYPHVYEPDRWERGESDLTLPDPSVIPEMFGDTMLVNGTVYPEATVEARRYRLRVLNACNARFLNLQLYVDDGSPDGITLNPSNFTPTNAKGPDFLVIGAEGGFLFKPTVVRSNIPFNPNTLGGSLITGPAERWDLIVDFSGFAGQKVILYNDAPAPFPTGDPINDYFPGAPDNPTVTEPGFGPNTRQLMRFNVVPARSADAPLRLMGNGLLTAGLDPLLARPDGMLKSVPPKARVRPLTLNEDFDEFGRLIQLLGTNVPFAGDTFGRPYDSPATETPSVGATEIWQIANITGDTHPIHFHLVNVQVLARQPFDVDNYHGTPIYTGPMRGPEPTENGWKETVKMHPGEVTTVIMKFDLPRVPFQVPPSPRTGGNEYVWHCHILEHEEHDMMRPLVVG